MDRCLYIETRFHALPCQIQPASVDLRLGPVAYRVPASFLPNRGSTVRKRLEEFTSYQVDLTGGAVLERGCVYIVPLLEELNLPRDHGTQPRNAVPALLSSTPEPVSESRRRRRLNFIRPTPERS